ncbi:hypothetical protein NFI00_000075 [Salmonella enterica]|nr:hypothetical protein [Salmonella enterica]
MSEIVNETIEEIETAHPLVDVTPELEAVTDHAEEVIQGTLDTLEGNEGYGLTSAQRYLNSVLYAAGEVPAHVAGNEGVLSTIKGWAGKAIDAIKRAFKAIWDYLFGKKNVEEEVKLLRGEVKTTVEKVNTFKQKAKSSEGTSGNVVIELANNYARAATEVQATDPALAKQYETAAEKLKENPVITSMSDSRIVMDNKLYNKIKAIAHAADEHAKKCVDDYLDLRGTIHDQANLSEISVSFGTKSMHKLMEVVDGIKGVDDITKSLATLDGHISSWGIVNTLASMKRIRSKVEAKIKRFESEINSQDEQEQKAMRNDISDFQLIVRMCKSVISRMEAQLNAAKRLAKMLPKLHRLPA